uniref:Fibronectin type-III domain-containing protein n=1 Tax=Timema tahoe TaxID=61484 RepID=A0A7R9FIN9_9NEOP|nr:unnamed protein product [Timema tahoe]
MKVITCCRSVTSSLDRPVQASVDEKDMSSPLGKAAVRELPWDVKAPPINNDLSNGLLYDDISDDEEMFLRFSGGEDDDEETRVPVDGKGASRLDIGPARDVKVCVDGQDDAKRTVCSDNDIKGLTSVERNMLCDDSGSDVKVSSRSDDSNTHIPDKDAGLETVVVRTCESCYENGCCGSQRKPYREATVARAYRLVPPGLAAVAATRQNGCQGKDSFFLYSYKSGLADDDFSSTLCHVDTEGVTNKHVEPRTAEYNTSGESQIVEQCHNLLEICVQKKGNESKSCEESGCEMIVFDGPNKESCALGTYIDHDILEAHPTDKMILHDEKGDTEDNQDKAKSAGEDEVKSEKQTIEETSEHSLTEPMETDKVELPSCGDKYVDLGLLDVRAVNGNVTDRNNTHKEPEASINIELSSPAVLCENQVNLDGPSPITILSGDCHTEESETKALCKIQVSGSEGNDSKQVKKETVEVDAPYENDEENMSEITLISSEKIFLGNEGEVTKSSGIEACLERTEANSLIKRLIQNNENGENIEVLGNTSVEFPDKNKLCDRKCERTNDCEKLSETTQTDVFCEPSGFEGENESEIKKDEKEITFLNNNLDKVEVTKQIDANAPNYSGPMLEHEADLATKAQLSGQSDPLPLNYMDDSTLQQGESMASWKVVGCEGAKHEERDLDDVRTPEVLSSECHHSNKDEGNVVNIKMVENINRLEVESKSNMIREAVSCQVDESVPRPDETICAHGGGKEEEVGGLSGGAALDLEEENQSRKRCSPTAKVVSDPKRLKLEDGDLHRAGNHLGVEEREHVHEVEVGIPLPKRRKTTEDDFIMVFKEESCPDSQVQEETACKNNSSTPAARDVETLSRIGLDKCSALDGGKQSSSVDGEQVVTLGMFLVDKEQSVTSLDNEKSMTTLDKGESLFEGNKRASLPVVDEWESISFVDKEDIFPALDKSKHITDGDEGLSTVSYEKCLPLVNKKESLLILNEVESLPLEGDTEESLLVLHKEERYSVVNKKESLLVLNQEENLSLVNKKESLLVLNQEENLSFVDGEESLFVLDKEESLAVVDKEESLAIVDKEKRLAVVNKEGLPVVNKEESLPIVNKVESLPVMNKEESLPVVNKEESLPIVNKEESLPVVNKEESLPVVNKEESLPVVNKEESFPVVNKEESFPVVNKEESLPIVNKEESLPIVNKEEILPVVNKNESLPVVNKEESMPVVNKEESMPVVIKKEGVMVLGHKESLSVDEKAKSLFVVDKERKVPVEDEKESLPVGDEEERLPVVDREERLLVRGKEESLSIGDESLPVVNEGESWSFGNKEESLPVIGKEENLLAPKEQSLSVLDKGESLPTIEMKKTLLVADKKESLLAVGKEESFLVSNDYHSQPTSKENLSSSGAGEMLPVFNEDILLVTYKEDNSNGAVNEVLDKTIRVKEDILSILKQDELPSTDKHECLPSVEEDMLLSASNDAQICAAVVDASLPAVIKEGTIFDVDKDQTLPAVVKESLLAVDNPRLPAIDKGSIPTIDKESLFAVDKASISAVDKESLPAVDKESIPAVDKESLPAVDKESLPSVDKESLLGADKESLPADDKESLAAVDKESLPAVDKESLPSVDKESLLGADKESLPDSDKENLPVTYKESLPALSQVEAADNSTLTASEANEDSLHAMLRDEDSLLASDEEDTVTTRNTFALKVKGSIFGKIKESEVKPTRGEFSSDEDSFGGFPEELLLSADDSSDKDESTSFSADKNESMSLSANKKESPVLADIGKVNSALKGKEENSLGDADDTLSATEGKSETGLSSDDCNSKSTERPLDGDKKLATKGPVKGKDLGLLGKRRLESLRPEIIKVKKVRISPEVEKQLKSQAEKEALRKKEPAHSLPAKTPITNLDFAIERVVSKAAVAAPGISDEERSVIMSYMKAFHKVTMSKMTRDDLEEMVMQKMCELIAHRSELGQNRQKIQSLELLNDQLRRKSLQLQKQAKDLHTVTQRLVNELRTRKDGKMTPVRLTRSVGLQVQVQTQPMAVSILSILPWKTETYRGPGPELGPHGFISGGRVRKPPPITTSPPSAPPTIPISVSTPITSSAQLARKLAVPPQSRVLPSTPTTGTTTTFVAATRVSVIAPPVPPSVKVSQPPIKVCSLSSPVKVCSLPSSRPVKVCSLPSSQPVKVCSLPSSQPVKVCSLPSSRLVKVCSLPSSRLVKVCSLPSSRPVKVCSLPSSTCQDVFPTLLDLSRCVPYPPRLVKVCSLPSSTCQGVFPALLLLDLSRCVPYPPLDLSRCVPYPPLDLSRCVPCPWPTTSRPSVSSGGPPTVRVQPMMLQNPPRLSPIKPTKDTSFIDLTDEEDKGRPSSASVRLMGSLPSSATVTSSSPLGGSIRVVQPHQLTGTTATLLTSTASGVGGQRLAYLLPTSSSAPGQSRQVYITSSTPSSLASAATVTQVHSTSNLLAMSCSYPPHALLLGLSGISNFGKLDVSKVQAEKIYFPEFSVRPTSNMVAVSRSNPMPTTLMFKGGAVIPVQQGGSTASSATILRTAGPTVQVAASPLQAALGRPNNPSIRVSSLGAVMNKLAPPKPDLKISRVTNNKPQPGIVLSWNMQTNEQYEEIASYQLYAYQETSAHPNTNLWKKVGDVKALPLPMACTLTQFMEGHKYHFAVRAVDIHTRVGPFSIPGNIVLTKK